MDLPAAAAPEAAADIALPLPDELGGPPLAATLGQRRSVRAYAPRVLTHEELGQLAWAAQGITEPARGLRTAPSAGALYPLELDAVTPGGVYRYRPHSHTLACRAAGDARPALARAAMSQSCVATAACVFALLAVASRTQAKYGARGTRYALLEAGHVAQNLLLQASALGLAAVPVGAFDDAALARALGCAGNEEPVYLVAVGAPRVA